MESDASEIHDKIGIELMCSTQFDSISASSWLALEDLMGLSHVQTTVFFERYV